MASELRIEVGRDVKSGEGGELFEDWLMVDGDSAAEDSKDDRP